MGGSRRQTDEATAVDALCTSGRTLQLRFPVQGLLIRTTQLPKNGQMHNSSVGIILRQQIFTTEPWVFSSKRRLAAEPTLNPSVLFVSGKVL